MKHTYANMRKAFRIVQGIPELRKSLAECDAKDTISDSSLLSCKPPNIQVEVNARL